MEFASRASRSCGLKYEHLEDRHARRAGHELHARVD